jgi:hypothetical protein
MDVRGPERVAEEPSPITAMDMYESIMKAATHIEQFPKLFKMVFPLVAAVPVVRSGGFTFLVAWVGRNTNRGNT